MAFWEKEEVVRVIEKSGGRIIVKAVKSHTDKFYLDIRFYYRDDDDEYRPSKKGLAIPYDKLDEVIEGVMSGRGVLDNIE